jgi:5-methylthioadenosine/S-adenosylhomocysteine deaminase
MLEPEIGRFVEVKSRTWSRRDAEHKAGLAHELLAALGISNAERMTSDYIEVVKSA